MTRLLRVAEQNRGRSTESDGYGVRMSTTANGSDSSSSTLGDPEKRVAAFFYGSFIRREVLAKGSFQPTTIEVATLNGYDIAFDPHANVFRSPSHAVCGVLVYPSHQELDRLYSRDGVGVFLPEAVLVETETRHLVPAICYMPPKRGTAGPDLKYVALLIAAAREHGFPEWYLARLESVQ